MTHTHYDHTGCSEQIRKATGAKVVVGAAEAEFLRQGHTGVPRGTNAFFRMIGNAEHDIEVKALEYYTPVTRDIIEVDEQAGSEATPRSRTAARGAN